MWHVIEFLGICLSQISILTQPSLFSGAEITYKRQFMCFFFPIVSAGTLRFRNPIKVSVLQNVISRNLSSISFPVSEIELFWDYCLCEAVPCSREYFLLFSSLLENSDLAARQLTPISCVTTELGNGLRVRLVQIITLCYLHSS